MFVAICLVAFLVVLIVWLVNTNVMELGRILVYSKNIPGPKPIFPFGNMLDFLGSTEEFLHKLIEYHDTYGEIVKVHDGSFSVAVVVADHKFMKFLLTSTKAIEKANQYAYFHNWLGTGLFTSTGVKWRKRRKVITPSFHFSILNEYFTVFESSGDVFINKLRRHVGQNSVDIYPLLKLCTLDIICEAAMGISVKAQVNGDSEYVRSVKEMCEIVIDRTFSGMPVWAFPFTPNYFKEKKALKVLHSYTLSIIDRKLEQAKYNKDNGISKDDVGNKKKMAFLDLLLQCYVDGKPLSREDLREEVDTFVFGGHDTISSAIPFALYSLATNPEVQEKAVEEQKLIFGCYLKEAKATANDMQDMKYLELVIKETLRLYPSAPFIGRKLSEDTEFEGVIYPKGLTIMMLPFRSQRNPTYFPDPEKFKPERFMENDGKYLFSYVPFSAGPRNCIGQKFAMSAMKSIISKVIRNFELLPAAPEHKLKLAPEVVLMSTNGVRIALKERCTQY